jgi:aspartate 1-decarboxylase
VDPDNRIIELGTDPGGVVPGMAGDPVRGELAVGAR